MTCALLLAALFAAAPAQKPAPKPAPPPADRWMAAAREGKDLYATLKTSQGDIVLRLFAKDAPKAVENFVGLATGEKEWTHPETKKVSKRPYYDGLLFHRVIPGFIIQTGDPTGMGYGGPGYRFDNETQSGRQFDRAGMVAMANAGPNTNGSQFFITLGPAPHLNDRYTLFGEVVSGMDVVEKISKVPRDPRTDKPEKPVTLKSVLVSEAPNNQGAPHGKDDGPGPRGP